VSVDIAVVSAKHQTNICAMVTLVILTIYMEMTMSDLTSEQVDAITNAWIDLSATSDMLNGDDPIDRRAWQEMSVATKDSMEELEKEFPFLIQDINDE